MAPYISELHPVPGSIQYAECSREADAQSIRREIGDQVHRVDHALHVLLTAGMSTPALREIAHSVDIQHAAFSEIAGAAFLLGPFGSMSMTETVLNVFYGECGWYLAILPVASLLSGLVLFLLLIQRHWDEQRFILKVMSKFPGFKLI